MSSGRVQDPEGAKQLVISYQTAAGATSAIIRGRFPLMTYKDALTRRLKVEERMRAGDMRQPAEGSKKMLIYSASIHPKSILNPAGCTANFTPKERASWIAATMPQLDNYPDTVGHTDQGYMDVDADGAAGDSTPANNANIHTEGTTRQQQQQPLPQTHQQ